MKKEIFTTLLGISAIMLITGCGEQMEGEGIAPLERKRTMERQRRRAAQPRATVAAKPERNPKPNPKPRARTEAKQAFYTKELIVADFNSGEKPNNIGGDFGAWDKDPADFSQTCSESFDSRSRYGPKGFGLKLTYDVDSTNPAYNGFWMFLQGLDASVYDSLLFRVKGDPGGYTTVFKVELKNAKGEVGRYYVSTVSDAWQRVAIPLRNFKGMSDFSNLTEFVIVFEDRIVSNKEGALYIDDIAFARQ